MKAKSWTRWKMLTVVPAVMAAALAVAAGEAVPAAAAGGPGGPSGSATGFTPGGTARSAGEQSSAARSAATRLAAGSQSPDGTATQKNADQPKQTEKTGIVPGTVIAVLSGASVTGGKLRADSTMLAPKTSSTVVNSALAKFRASSIQPVFSGLSSATASALTSAARQRLGDNAINPDDVVVVHVAKGDEAAAAKTLAATSGVSYAEPDRYVETMDTPGQTLATGTTKAPALKMADVKAVTAQGTSGLPSNYGLQSSFDSYLNAQGLDVGGAYAALQRKYGQLPGTGETITNVSVGDLTDASMNDTEVNDYGPTTILQGGQRYLDLPAMPLIPAYVAEPDGSLSGSASIEGTGDPSLDEIGLDFSVMAPLPDADQRSGETGSGFTDLLGIAPGSKYRLVEPATPTTDEIAQAFLAAAQQTPRPDVITASLGFGTDAEGFPGRYLEDDPLMQSVIASIVQHYGITVVDSANDGTRLYTPTAVGPDGGATPTDVAATPSRATSIDTDQDSTAPSEVVSSGSIDAGATTTDDTLSIPPGSGGNAWRNPTYTETRTDGGADFASGFGSRVTLSAPGDNIPAFEHDGPDADSVAVALNGGTSASAPEIAAAAAIVLQAARLTHQSYGPAQVTRVLQQTGRKVATPPQADQPLNVGPQVDVTAAVDAVLTAGHVTLPTTSIARLSVAHRVSLDSTGSAFTEYTDPGDIDLQDPAAGSAQAMTDPGATGPVTFAADIVGTRGTSYALTVGKTTWTNASDYIRVTPAELLAAAGDSLDSSSSRTVPVTYQVRDGRRLLAQASETLTVGPYDGTSTYAPAPVAPQVTAAGQSVKVSYDLTGAGPQVSNPELVVSAVGHWSPTLGPEFNASYAVPLTGLAGAVTIPASAFADGGGIYGIGIDQDPAAGVYGAFTAIRNTGFAPGAAGVARPAAPLVAAAGAAPALSAAVDRAKPDFTLSWNAGPRAAGAIMEISAPAPTLQGSYNTFGNLNGTKRDDDGYDTGSVVYEKLPASAGTRTFNALSLGLRTSLSYDVRILPVGRSGAIAGQASPISALEVDDGVAPDGYIVGNFAIAGPNSVVALVGTGSSEVVHYDPATGTYGSVIASDATGGQFYVFGVDSADHTTLVDDAHSDSAGINDGNDVELYDTRSGALLASPDLSGYTLKGGVVDATRGRADLLGTDTSTGQDAIITIDMVTGAVRTVPDVDDGTIADGAIQGITLDGATGVVYLAAPAGGFLCRAGGDSIAAVNPGTGSVSVIDSGTSCDTDLAVDSANGDLISTDYRSISLNIPGTSSLSVMPESDPSNVTSYSLRAGEASELGIDPVSHLALTMYPEPAGPAKFGGIPLTDSNATSVVDVVSTATGTVDKVLGGFSEAALYGYPFSVNDPGIQLDPATRTGYTFAPGDDQIQEFSY